LVLLAMLLLVGVAMAVPPAPTSGDLTVTGIVAQPQLGILVPANTPSITLDRGADNAQELCHVNVVSTGADTWKLTTTANNANMYFGTGTTPITYTYLASVMYITTAGGAYQAFAPANLITSGLVTTTPELILTTGTGNQNVEIWVKQPVSTSDSGGDYTITFTFGVAKA
jgi:hypothetical protein